MSIILDALKKSEAERQQHGAPGLYEARIAPPRPRFPAWLAIVCALLLVNAVGLAWVLLRGHGGVTAPPAATPAAPATARDTLPTPPMPQPALASARDTGPADAAPASAGDTATTAARNTAAAAADADPDPDQDDAPAVAPARTAPPAADAGTGGAHVYRVAPERALPSGPPPPRGDIPSYQDAAATGGLPPNLAINLHSWSKDPSQRYILLNMVRLKEGDTSPQGVKVETITQDGAILSWQGREFMLPR